VVELEGREIPAISTMTAASTHTCDKLFLSTKPALLLGQIGLMLLVRDSIFAST
jgi:hypothetical protein